MEKILPEVPTLLKKGAGANALYNNPGLGSSPLIFSQSETLSSYQSF